MTKNPIRSPFSVAWLLSYISIASVSATLITPALPQIQHTYGLSLSAVEWLVSSFLIGYVIGQLIYGPLANRFGRLMALRAGLLLNVIGVILCLVVIHYNSFWLLVIGRFITALGAASSLACTFMLINEWLAETQRQNAIAAVVVSFALGIGLAVFLGGVITEYWTWQGCFWFLLMHGLIMFIGTRLFSETLVSPRPIHLLTIFHDYAVALRSISLIKYSMVVGYCSAIAYCYSAAGPQIAQRLLSLSSSQYGSWNGLNIIGMLAGGILVKHLLGKFSANRVIAIGLSGVAFGIMNLFLIWLMQSHSVGWFFMTTAIFYLFTGCLFSGGSLIASTAIPDKASAAAMMSFINMFSATSSVIIMGYLSNNALTGFMLMLSIIWVLIVASLIMKKSSFNKRARF